jgi:hypothetical protein
VLIDFVPGMESPATHQCYLLYCAGQCCLYQAGYTHIISTGISLSVFVVSTPISLCQLKGAGGTRKNVGDQNYFTSIVQTHTLAEQRFLTK